MKELDGQLRFHSEFWVDNPTNGLQSVRRKYAAHILARCDRITHISISRPARTRPNSKHMFFLRSYRKLWQHNVR